MFIMQRRSSTMIARCSCIVAAYPYKQPRKTFSFSADTATPFDIQNCPIRSFAKKYPDAARQVLSVPSFRVLNHVSNGGNPLLRSCGTLEQYIHWRGWDLDGLLKAHDLRDDDEPYQAAVGLLSHPLTFPLTLGSNIQAFLPPFDTDNLDHVDDSGKYSRQLRLCCVGARAECTLPDDYWRELLTAILSCNQARNDHQSFHCAIDFVGPDVPRNLKRRTLTLLDTRDRSSLQQTDDKLDYTLTINYFTSFFHEIVLKSKEKSIHKCWDGYILFNPGFGHPNLEKQWGSTLQFLLGTGKPLLMTAHSALDAERDASILEMLLSDTLVIIDVEDQYCMLRIHRHLECATWTRFLCGRNGRVTLCGQTMVHSCC